MSLKKLKSVGNSVKTAKTFDALKNRRKQNYANEITGSGNDGNLSLAIKLAYTAPTMSTLPIIVLLAVYMNVYYEKLGASLTYIRYVQFCSSVCVCVCVCVFLEIIIIKLTFFFFLFFLFSPIHLY